MKQAQPLRTSVELRALGTEGMAEGVSLSPHIEFPRWVFLIEETDANGMFLGWYSVWVTNFKKHSTHGDRDVYCRRVYRTLNMHQASAIWTFVRDLNYEAFNAVCQMEEK